MALKIKIAGAIIMLSLISLTCSFIYCVEQTEIITKNIVFAKGHERTIHSNSIFDIDWESEDPSVALVDKHGKVKAKNSGDTEIVAKCLWKTKACHVSVTNPIFNKRNVELNIGEYDYIAINGTTSDAKWETSDENIVEVYNGKIKAISTGTATIKAVVDDAELFCQVTVLKPEIELESVTKGESEPLSLKNAPEGITPIWTVSDYNLADIEDNKIIGKNIGKVSLYAKIGEMEIKKEIKISGDQDLEIIGDSVQVGNKETLKIKNFVDSYTVSWKGAKSQGDGSAVFTGKEKGKHTVTAIIDTGNEKQTLTKEILVHNKHLNMNEWSGQLAETFKLSMEEGENPEYEYDETYFTRNGIEFRALRVGETPITVKDGDVTETCNVTVTPAPGMDGSTVGENVIAYALQFLGNPYVYGGSDLNNGTDCSGFVMRVYEHFGVSLPHSSSSQRSYGTAVDGIENAVAGDIICYNGHVALYMGDGRIIHASNPRTDICIGNNPSYRNIVTIRRLF